MNWIASSGVALAVGVGGTLLTHRLLPPEPPTCTVTVSDDVDALETRLRDMTAEVSQLEFLVGQFHRTVSAMRADVTRHAAGTSAPAAVSPAPAPPAQPAVVPPAPARDATAPATPKEPGAAPPARRVRVVGNQPSGATRSAPAVAANHATPPGAPSGGPPAISYDDGDAPPPPPEPARDAGRAVPDEDLVYSDGD